MSISLKKGEITDLRKRLDLVRVILGWEKKKTDISDDFDLDASVFMLDNKGKCPSENHFVFCGNPKSPCGAIIYKDDNKTNDEDEEIEVYLKELPENIKNLVFVVTIYDAKKRKQNFGMVNNAYIKLIDTENGGEIARYDLAGDFLDETGVNFGEIYKHKGQWKFKAVGQGDNSGLAGFLKQYGFKIDEESEDL